jgi:hypothetical protein
MFIDPLETGSSIVACIFVNHGNVFADPFPRNWLHNTIVYSVA